MNLTLLWKPRKLRKALRDRLRQRRALYSAVRRAEARYVHDPRWRLDDVPGYFVPRPNVPSDDLALLQRIVTAYQSAKRDQQDAGPAFNISNEWVHIYERKLGGVMEALRSKDLAALDRIYSNFFRDPCSTGLAGVPLDMPKIFFGGHIKPLYRKYVLGEVLHRADLWSERTGGIYSRQALSTPDVGNPYGSNLEGIFVRPGGDYQHFYSHAIRQMISAAPAPVVAELGGGFGGMAYYLLRDAPAVAYIDFDLPEAIALASYYLMKSLPEQHFVLYGESTSPVEAVRPGVAALLPSFVVTQLPPRSVDVSFNSYSLAEMSPQAIDTYVAELTRITRGSILHVNHNRDALVIADNFGIEQHGFHLVSRRLAGWTSGSHPDADEMEYVYERDQP